jgi:Lon-like ATP-dependent protease
LKKHFTNEKDEK